jgi:excisionase family DNA binding protein
MRGDKKANLRQPETVAEARQRASPAEMALTLSEVKDALQGYETTALAGVAATLAEAAQILARTARELHKMSREEWMDVEEAAAYLRRTPKAFEKVIANGEIPKHYLTERGILFSRKELDEWLMGR